GEISSPVCAMSWISLHYGTEGHSVGMTMGWPSFVHNQDWLCFLVHSRTGILESLTPIQPLNDQGHQSPSQISLAGAFQVQVTAVPADVKLVVFPADRMLGTDDIAGHHVQALAFTLAPGGVFHVGGF